MAKKDDDLTKELLNIISGNTKVMKEILTLVKNVSKPVRLSHNGTGTTTVEPEPEAESQTEPEMPEHDGVTQDHILDLLVAITEDDRLGNGAARKFLNKFKTKAGKKCEKRSDIQPKDFQKFLDDGEKLFGGK